jgi:hypothetical protein
MPLQNAKYAFRVIGKESNFENFRFLLVYHCKGLQLLVIMHHETHYVNINLHSYSVNCTFGETLFNDISVSHSLTLRISVEILSGGTFKKNCHACKVANSLPTFEMDCSPFSRPQTSRLGNDLGQSLINS